MVKCFGGGWLMLRLFYPGAYADNVFAIDFQKLYDKGYRGILFDVDNTLVHHGEDSTPEVDELFCKLHKMGFKTVLVSDNGKSRLQRFIANIDTPYIDNADKPQTKSYYKALELLGVAKEQAVCIGDQVFTDILGANRSGIDSILVHFIQVKQNEKIGIRRHIEKIILFFYRRSRYCDRLGDVLKSGENNG